MTMRTIAASAAAVAAVAAAAAPASAEHGRLTDFALRLSNTASAAPTGLTLHAQFHRAGDPDAKPSPIRTAVIDLPGQRIDTTAMPQCTASDAEIQALGSDACPHETELTVGTLTAISGFGAPIDPIVGDDHVFNGPNQLIEVITVPGGPASPAVDRLKIDGSTLTAHPPAAPGGPPDGQMAVRSIDFKIPVLGAAGRPYITTPPYCPASGHWTTTGRFGFADASQDVVESATPCTPSTRARPRPRPRRGRMRLTVAPRHVRAGRVARVRVRVSGSHNCVAGALIHLAGRTARADRRGRVRVAFVLRRPGLVRVTATSRGCRPAHVPVRVLR